MNNGVKPTYFATPADLRSWLAEHHDKAQELWVGYCLETLIEDSAHGRRITQLRRNPA